MKKIIPNTWNFISKNVLWIFILATTILQLWHSGPASYTFDEVIHFFTNKENLALKYEHSAIDTLLEHFWELAVLGVLVFVWEHLHEKKKKKEEEQENQNKFEDIIFAFLLKKEGGQALPTYLTEFKNSFTSRYTNKVTEVIRLISECKSEDFYNLKNSFIKLNLKKDEPLFINLNHVFKEILTIANNENRINFESSRMLVFLNHRYSICKKNYNHGDLNQKYELVTLLKAVLREFAALELYYHNEKKEKTTVHQAIIARVFEELLEVSQIKKFELIHQAWTKSHTHTFGLADKNLIFLMNLTDDLENNIMNQHLALNSAA